MAAALEREPVKPGEDEVAERPTAAVFPSRTVELSWPLPNEPNGNRACDRE